uniref:Uncharacterized protein n=1 Tax=Zeugodacus cucurbitae TaxID=28588 RepID=A0A0A1WHG2_ZEUCU
MRFLTIAFVFAFVAACSAQARLGIPEEQFIPLPVETARLGIPEERFIPLPVETARLGIPEERFIPLDQPEDVARLGIPEDKFIPLEDDNVEEEQEPINDIDIHRGEDDDEASNQLDDEGVEVGEPVTEPLPRSGNNVRIPHLWNRFERI